jgi:toxin ParE1/3/4
MDLLILNTAGQFPTKRWGVVFVHGRIKVAHEAEQWLHDIFDYISKENPEAALQTIESIYKNRNHSQYIRILLYGHYPITYLIKPDRNIDILGVFHDSLDIERYLIE